MPAKTSHSWINMFRPPYSKELPCSYKVRGPFNNFQKDIDILYDTFMESYNIYKAGEMPISSEDEFKSFGIPGPSQYKAFNELFDFFEDEEFEFLKYNSFYCYDLTQKKMQFERGILEFFEKLLDFDFIDQDKKVIFSSGTFYKGYLKIRNRILDILKTLHTEKEIKIQIFTNCKEEEIKGYDEFIKQIKGTSHFGLKDRIPIHFIQAGNDYFFIEFPHAEEVIVRLNMFLDLKEIKYKTGFNKADVEQYFYKLIQQAFN